MAIAAKTCADVIAAIERRAGERRGSSRLMAAVVEELRRIPHYNWVGFYLLSESEPPMLELAGFAGAPTPHVRIPLNQGICGAAVTAGQTIVVDDVARDPRYLACSLETKSEMVAPIFVHGRIRGELDLDSHTAAAFSDEDRRLIEQCAALVGRALEGEGQ